MTAMPEAVIEEKFEAAPAPVTAAARPLVTIITPTYNRADLLAETIISVLDQDYPAIEYIILDDGSKDNTAQVVDRFKDKVTYLYHDNMGETATVNKGLSMATGDIVCVVNYDDPLFTKDAVSVAVQCLSDNPDALMAYPDWVLIGEDGNALSYRKLPDYSIENMILDRNVAIGPGMFIRKSTIDKIGLRDPNIKYVGDLDYSFRMASVGKIVRIPAYLATHRVHTQSLSLSAKGKRMSDEVLGLCTKYIDGDAVPHHIKERKKHILAEWTLMSMYYLGYRYPVLCIKRVVTAFKVSPFATMCLIGNVIKRKSMRPAYKIWALIRKMRGLPA